MLKKLVDNNIIIDRLSNPALHQDIFLRVVTPSMKDYETEGEILAGLQRSKGYDMKKSASLTNECLIAASARSMGAVLYTQNKKDFQAIQDVFDCKVVFV